MASFSSLVQKTARYRYVGLNTLISLIAFGRNVMFMRTLGTEDLAQVAIMQTIIMLIGFSQLGGVSGAYVLMAEKREDQSRLVVNAIWAGLLILALGFCCAYFVDLESYTPAFIDPVTLWLGVVAGLATLAATFLKNALVAYGLLDRSNVVGLISVGLSVGIGILSLQYGLQAALFAVLAQPLIMALGVVVLSPAFRPVTLRLDKDVVRRVFAVGVPQFVAGIFILLSYQVERWTIVAVLGEEALGQFYLVIMYMSFFVLVPAAILNLHFPPAIRALQAEKIDEFLSSSRRHIRDLGIFCLAALPLTIFPLSALLNGVLPQFSGQETLVYLVYPAMVLFVARDASALVFLATKQTGLLVVSGALFFGSYTVLIGALYGFDMLDLVNLLLARGAASAISLVYALAQRHKILGTIRAKQGALS